MKLKVQRIKGDITIINVLYDIWLILFNPLNKNLVISCKFIKQFVSQNIDGWHKFPRRLPCSRRIILTYDESDTITDEFGTIEVMPLWKWILEN